MPRHCYHVLTADGARAIICGNLGAPCSVCRGVAGFQCDYPVNRPALGDGTCDRHICEKHATQVGPNRHYCPTHAKAAGTTDDLFATP